MSRRRPSLSRACCAGLGAFLAVAAASAAGTGFLAALVPAALPPAPWWALGVSSPDKRKLRAYGACERCCRCEPATASQLINKTVYEYTALHEGIERLT